MNILIDIDHPSTVHLFKHFIREMEKRGHTVTITAIEKEVVFDLLAQNEFAYLDLGDPGTSKGQKIRRLPAITRALDTIVKETRPVVILGASTIPGVWVGKMRGVPCVNFEDTEIATLAHFLYVPFVTAIVSPRHYGKDFGKKHIRYDGFKELAYLHPNRFTPDPRVLPELGLAPEERFFLVRFSAWGATHDIGRAGLDTEAKQRLISLLSQKGKVFISAEGPLEPEFERYRYPLPANRIFDAMHYAHLFVTDAHTMATEAAVLGTPTVRCNSLAGRHDMRNFPELEEHYELMYSFNDVSVMLERIETLLAEPDLKKIWQERRARLLAEKVDLTAWMIDFVTSRFAAAEAVADQTKVAL